MLERPRKSHIRIFVFTKMRMLWKKATLFQKGGWLMLVVLDILVKFSGYFFSIPCTKRVQAKDTISAELPAMAVM